ncbi:MAG TPA: methyltransferase domain-containing protein [Anaerolineales bacterium]|nr:methyltransferase domain-containing protein [Anaerolineales bacterium]
MSDSLQDIWSRWLLQRRFGGNAEMMKKTFDFLHPIRDKVLSHINLEELETLLDVGCGDGLIAFGALEKFEKCRVIFSDISEDLLQHVERLAREMNVSHRCQFVRASADELSIFEDASVDAVTTRSVLMYVSAKKKAFDEFHRVLRSGGELSIFEPINRFAFPEPPDRFSNYDITPVIELAQKVKATYQRIQPETDPMLDFNERDLVAYAEKAGFSEIHLELQIEIRPVESLNWSAYLHMAGNPKIPTLEEAIQQALTPAEAEDFKNHLRPLVEAGQGIRRFALAYLWAVK